MSEQKNLLLAIAISIAIIVVFQFLFPQQPVMMADNEKADTKELINNQTSIDQIQEEQILQTKTKEEILSEGDRVTIETKSLFGSINLKGAIIDDLILLHYKESLEENANNINLLSPVETENPYFVEFGWKELTKNENNIDLPNLDTIWSSNSKLLNSESPIVLTWKNKQSVTFKIYISPS